MPARNAAKKNIGPMRLAGSAPSQKGLVLDYNIINGSLTNLLLASDSTTFVTNAVYLYGSCLIEGSSVTKFSTNNSASIIIPYGTNLVCQTGPYRMASFTAKDDDTIGSQISGSTGTPPTTMAAPLWQASGVVPRQTGVICAFPFCDGPSNWRITPAMGEQPFMTSSLSTARREYIWTPPPSTCATPSFTTPPFSAMPPTSFAIPSPPILICKT